MHLERKPCKCDCSEVTKRRDFLPKTQELTSPCTLVAQRKDICTASLTLTVRD